MSFAIALIAWVAIFSTISIVAALACGALIGNGAVDAPLPTTEPAEPERVSFGFDLAKAGAIGDFGGMAIYTSPHLPKGALYAFSPDKLPPIFEPRSFVDMEIAPWLPRDAWDRCVARLLAEPPECKAECLHYCSTWDRARGVLKCNGCGEVLGNSLWSVV